MLLRKLILSVVIQNALQLGLLFLPAGTWRWWQAWLLFGLMFAATVATCIDLYAHNKYVLAERLKPPLQKGQPLVDKILVPLLIVAYCGWIAFIPVDVFRLGRLLGQPPPAVTWLGLALFNAGWWIAYRSIKANAFAAPVVKRQTERRQTVIDTGVYGIVRHPMYAGAALVFLGMPLWLGSLAATLAGLVPILILAVRIVFEERFLRRELEGYEEYTRRIRWRLLPGVW